jgi:hypothetical protein
MFKTAAIATTCALAGAGAGIAGSEAHHGHHGRGFFRGPVHSESVFAARDGSFKTITMDRGEVVSVSGDQLTLREGTKTATYKTVTLTVPADKLTGVTAGEKAVVVQSPKGVFVSAR